MFTWSWPLAVVCGVSALFLACAVFTNVTTWLDDRAAKHGGAPGTSPAPGRPRLNLATGRWHAGEPAPVPDFRFPAPPRWRSGPLDPLG